MFHVKVTEADGSNYSNELIVVDGVEHRTNESGVAEVNLPSGKHMISILQRMSGEHEVHDGQTLEIVLP